MTLKVSELVFTIGGKSYDIVYVTAEMYSLTFEFVLLFFIQYEIYNDQLPKIITTKHYTTLQGRYQEEQKYHGYPLAFNTEHINLKYN